MEGLREAKRSVSRGVCVQSVISLLVLSIHLGREGEGGGQGGWRRGRKGGGEEGEGGGEGGMGGGRRRGGGKVG